MDILYQILNHHKSTVIISLAVLGFIILMWTAWESRATILLLAGMAFGAMAGMFVRRMR